MLKQRYLALFFATNLLFCGSEWALFSPPSSPLWPPASRGSRPAVPPADSQEDWPDYRLPDWGTEKRSEPTRVPWPRMTEPLRVPDYLQERRQTQIKVLVLNPIGPGHFQIHVYIHRRTFQSIRIWLDWEC